MTATRWLGRTSRRVISEERNDSSLRPPPRAPDGGALRKERRYSMQGTEGRATCSGVGVLDPPTDVAPPAPDPAPAPPPVIEPLPLGPLIFAASLVVGAAEQLINRTTDAIVANSNDQIKYDATMSVVTVENAHKTNIRESTRNKDEKGKARNKRERDIRHPSKKNYPPRNLNNRERKDWEKYHHDSNE